MKKFKNWLVYLSVLLMVFSWSQAFAAAKSETDDRTLSPYFFIPSDDSNTDRLPLKATSASVTISGVIADVLVTQVYKNEGKKPLEAIYIFPASTRAAVYGMKMTIGKRVIEAQIKKRDEARKDYEAGKARRQKSVIAGAAAPQCFSDECGQHHARQ